MEMNLTKWRYAVPLAAFALAFACSDGPTGPTGGDPGFTADAPLNDEGDLGSCMIDDAKRFPQFTDGWNAKSDPTKTNNCTTNDVRLANARATAYLDEDPASPTFDEFIDLDPGDAIVCTAGKVTIKLVADLVQTSSSERNDFGIWLRTDEGSAQYPLSAGARTGACNHYNLPTSPLLAGTVDTDSDSCADMVNQGSASGLDLGEITIPCLTNQNNQLTLNSCIGWKVPGDEGAFPKGQCPAYETTGSGKNQVHNLIAGSDGFRAGTLPGNTSKCNCEPFLLDVFVAPATITIVKECQGGTGPSFSFTGAGPSGAVTVPNLGCGDSEQVVETNTDFGAYSFTEGADPAGWEFVSAACVNGSSPTAAGRSAGATIASGDAVTCTFINRKLGSLTLVKRVVNAHGGDADVDDFSLNTDAGALNFGAGAADGANTLKYTSDPIPVNAGTFSLEESAVSGYALGTWSCVGGSNVNSSATAGSVDVAQGENVTCTITNSDIAPTLTLEKEVDNTGGGTAAATDWELCADGGVATDFCDIAAGGAVIASVGPEDVTADVGYVLSENGPGGYDPSAWSCTGDGVFDATTSTITLQLDEHATCRIVNTFIPQLEGEWCSPGFWRNNWQNWDAVAWPAVAAVHAATTYSALPASIAGIDKPDLKSGDPTTVTVLDILLNPQTYGGPAFNYVGTYLSDLSGFDIQLDEFGDPIHNCPIDQQGNPVEPPAE